VIEWHTISPKEAADQKLNLSVTIDGYGIPEEARK